jgi:PAS domain S-box-containing protein
VLRAIEWILLGSASTAAIIVGARWRRPGRVMPWMMLAGSTASMGTGDVFYAFGLEGVAEYFYLAMFVMVAAALVQFTRGGSLLVDRARLIDMLAWGCATLLVVWVFIVGADHDLGKISAADVIGDLLLNSVAVRLVMAAGRNPSAKLLLAGAFGLLLSDVVYPLAPSPVTEIGFIILYVAWGVAALHPSMTGLTQPMAPRLRPWQGRWAALLAASVATPPLVLLYEAIRGDVRDGVVIAVAGAITLTLAITRLADSVSLSTHALNRERGLRTATAALVAAVDPAAVDQAVRSAVAELLPGPSVREIVFATDDHQLLTEALPATSERTGQRSWWLQDSPADEATLVCPLWLEPLAVARPGGGALVLTGRRDDLAMARDALEVLAGQAALALDRISLVEAVGRRDSDLYLRAVIRNTADMMLVIDEDQRIRYASPALRSLVGQDELSPLATLADLVHPDDRGQVRRALLSSGDGTVFCALQRPDHTQVYVEITYRDLRADRLVQGFVVTLRNVSSAHDPVEQVPHLDHVDELPAWVNRRSAQHKFRY